MYVCVYVSVYTDIYAGMRKHRPRVKAFDAMFVVKDELFSNEKATRVRDATKASGFPSLGVARVLGEISREMSRNVAGPPLRRYSLPSNRRIIPRDFSVR